VQLGINEYNLLQKVGCDVCQQHSLVISQDIVRAPSFLIMKVEDIEGSPNIDLEVVFGGCSYALTGLMLKEAGHFQTISKCGPYWVRYNDSSVSKQCK